MRTGIFSRFGALSVMLHETKGMLKVLMPKLWNRACLLLAQAFTDLACVEFSMTVLVSPETLNLISAESLF